jgi:cell division protein FtsZ
MIPTSAVKIIGLGGAGANMLERIALDGMEGAELLALNTDVRTLASSLALEKIQLGVNLTKGLGAGGDPELGHQAVLESEDQIRLAIQGRRIVFLCTGLGGGTGSGAAPIVTRIAREEGAFVVVFASMPFAFEGRRRREQAETALNELAVLSNALVTFDNNRMGELVLAKQGIHEAFAAADHMICESIKAVIRLVVRPGLINVGLDDLMSALRTNRSRCLFGSGLAAGKDRAAKALKNALSSPLLDQGALLKDAQTVLVHLSGGEDLTLFEIELLMQRLQKFVPEKAHVLFGAAIDPAMGDSLSITLISALPEDSLAAAPRDSFSQASQEPSLLDPSQGFTAPPTSKIAALVAEMAAEPEEDMGFTDATASSPSDAVLFSPASKFRRATTHSSAEEEEPPFAEEFAGSHEISPPTAVVELHVESPPDDNLGEITDAEPHSDSFAPGPKGRPPLSAPWGRATAVVFPEDIPPEDKEPETDIELKSEDMPKLKLGIKATGPQSELSLDSAPRGRFEGESPNVLDGEDLDLPPFLRKKK